MEASTALRVVASAMAVRIAVQSPKASWNAFVSGKVVSQRSGRIESSNACPDSCATTSVLAPE
jgi:hypothetical protein